MLKLLSYIFIFPVWGYQKLISPLFPNACRFDPTCSVYAIEAIKIRGPFTGLWLSFKRIIKCHPWGSSGYDPVPGHKQGDKKINDKDA
tara:strand:- start:158 stop:421 length:264 start_codon:yes stop_codon:yes gene_type:complete